MKILLASMIGIVSVHVSFGATLSHTTKLFSSLQRGDSQATIAYLNAQPDLLEARDREGRTPLRIATEQGDVTLVENLLNQGANPDARSSDKSVPLHHAVTVGSLPLVTLLIDRKANVNAQDSGGATPLAVACQLDRKEIAQLLVKSCNVNVPMLGNTTPLIFSVMRNKHWWVDFLLQHDADYTVKTDKGVTALSYACLYCYVSIAHLLSEHGADFTYQDEHKKNLILIAMTFTKRGLFPMILFLIDHGVRCDLPDNEGVTPLHIATREGDYELVELFLKRGAQPVPNVQGATPLSRAVEGAHYALVTRFLGLPHTPKQRNDALVLACHRGMLRIAKLLAAHGANTLYENKDGLTPLIAACIHEHSHVIEWLVKEKKVPVNYVNKNGLTACHYACFKEKIRLIKLLKELGADINFISPEHGTALAIASNQGHIQVAKALLEEQAEVDRTGARKTTPLMLCCLNNRAKLAELLIIQGKAQVNLGNDHGQTALILACEVGALACARLLLSHGADHSLRTIEGFTALHYASSHGHSELVELLMMHGVPVDELAPRRTSSLLLACETGRLKVVKTLVNHKANYTAGNQDGITPLICARAQGFKTIVSFLAERGAESPPDQLFSIIPLFLAPITERDDEIRQLSCGYCGEGNAPLHCSGCNEVRYCDNTCVALHKETHLKECRALLPQKNGYGKY